MEHDNNGKEETKPHTNSTTLNYEICKVLLCFGVGADVESHISIATQIIQRKMCLPPFGYLNARWEITVPGRRGPTCPTFKREFFGEIGVP